MRKSVVKALRRVFLTKPLRLSESVETQFFIVLIYFEIFEQANISNSDFGSNENFHIRKIETEKYATYLFTRKKAVASNS